VRRSFTAAVTIYSLAGGRIAAADCLLYLDVEPFVATAWSGDLYNVAPAVELGDGTYLLRLPGGKVGRITLERDAEGGLRFRGEGPSPV
jgi:hypothetical protein